MRLRYCGVWQRHVVAEVCHHSSRIRFSRFFEVAFQKKRKIVIQKFQVSEHIQQHKLVRNYCSGRPNYITRKLCYRKDDRAMRPIHGCPENCRDSLTTCTLTAILFPTFFMFFGSNRPYECSYKIWSSWDNLLMQFCWYWKFEILTSNVYNFADFLRPLDVRLMANFVGHYKTGKLCYRKDDRAMRPIHGCPENFRTPWLRPRLLFPTFFMGFCSDRPYKCSYIIWSP